MSTKFAVFAGGCFWCMQPIFDITRGVIGTVVGYTGGEQENPSYEEVCSGLTGHVEAIQIIYDPAEVSYEKLVDIFWHNIDPTLEDGQFYDRGTQYQTVIYYADDGQRKVAEESKKKWEEAKHFSIRTKILPQMPFYPAESYHQGYYKKNKAQYDLYHDYSGRDATLKKIWGKEERM